MTRAAPAAAAPEPMRVDLLLLALPVGPRRQEHAQRRRARRRKIRQPLHGRLGRIGIVAAAQHGAQLLAQLNLAQVRRPGADERVVLPSAQRAEEIQACEGRVSDVDNGDAAKHAANALWAGKASSSCSTSERLRPSSR